MHLSKSKTTPIVTDTDKELLLPTSVCLSMTIKTDHAMYLIHYFTPNPRLRKKSSLENVLKVLCK